MIDSMKCQANEKRQPEEIRFQNHSILRHIFSSIMARGQMDLANQHRPSLPMCTEPCRDNANVL